MVPSTLPAVSLTVLGCGSSSACPVIGCHCPTCSSTDPKNKRTRCSAWIQTDDLSLIIDTGTDFRSQALREKITHVDAILYTHPHADHLNGIDDLRAFCYVQQGRIPIYSNDATIKNITNRFDYAFLPANNHWDKPVLSANTVSGSFKIAGTEITAMEVPHGYWKSVAYRIGNIAWLTDLNDISDEVLLQLQGLDYLFLDCLRDTPYPSHLGFDQSVEFAQKIAAKQTYLIHMTHHLEYYALQERCPLGIDVAFDGLSVQSEGF